VTRAIAVARRKGFPPGVKGGKAPFEIPHKDGLTALEIPHKDGADALEIVGCYGG
jgi:hypothetical protein